MEVETTTTHLTKATPFKTAKTATTKKRKKKQAAVRPSIHTKQPEKGGKETKVTLNLNFAL